MHTREIELRSPYSYVTSSVFVGSLTRRRCLLSFPLRLNLAHQVISHELAKYRQRAAQL